jgi:SAM-dependent methyltransferase
MKCRKEISGEPLSLGFIGASIIGHPNAANQALVAVRAILLLLIAGFAAPWSSVGDAWADTPYSYGAASRDGIGKFYMGREISQVMGHLGAGWLERPAREVEERTDRLLKNLPLRSEYVVADIGAGTGYFSLPIARRVSRGRVLAVDIQQEMLDMLTERSRKAGLDNIEPILGAVDDPRLPESQVDLVLMVDAYHEFSHPREMMHGIIRGLKPGGRVVLIEYRAEDPEVPIKPLHKMTEAQAIKEMEVIGLRWVETRGFLPQQHFMVFKKP